MTEPVLRTSARFRGPNSGIVAAVFVVLFFAGLMPVTALGGMPYFPGPTASVNEMVSFFSQRQGGTLLCAFFQFGSAVPLGIFTMSMVARLKFLGRESRWRGYGAFRWIRHRDWAGYLLLRPVGDDVSRHTARRKPASSLVSRFLWSWRSRLFSVFRTSRSGNFCDSWPLQALAEVDRHSRFGCSSSWRTQLVRDLKRQVASADSSYALPRFCLDDCRWILAFQITQRGGHR